VQAGNLPLAASDLSRLVESYSGTRAADEASILLAQVRLGQGEAQTAVAELRAAIAAGLEEQFLASAHGLIGAAFEQQGQMDGAADAYLLAADAAWYGFLAAQYLHDAGRALVAGGDTARAADVYERLLQDHPDSPGATEAQVRLAELRPSEPS
jgi:predicted negative regulator of RcsB-dependent stress response